MTKSRNLPVLLLLMVLAVASAGCELAADIFKAGMWVGVIMVAVVVFAIVWVIGKVRG